MANFTKAYEKVIINEGGYVNDPKDSGGETFKGVSRVFNPTWQGWQIIDKFKTDKLFPSILYRNLELEKLINMFYKFNYWDKCMLDNIDNQEIAESIFDFGVNAGVKVSSKLAQKICNVDSDGIIGIKSIDAINSVKPEYFMPYFKIGRIEHYLDCVKNNSNNQKFLYGWIKRTLNK